MLVLWCTQYTVWVVFELFRLNYVLLQIRYNQLVTAEHYTLFFPQTLTIFMLFLH